MHKDIDKIIELLLIKFPNPKSELNFHNVFELWVATLLSAQCTDKRVNLTTNELFKKIKVAKDLSQMPIIELEKIIKPVNYYKTKARNLINGAKMIFEEFNNKIPDKLELLIKLPGVGIKTANVILSAGFGIPAMAVDTHVHRASNRIGLVNTKSREQTEKEIIKVIPQKYWINAHNLLVLLGRYICIARKPKCEECPISVHCDYYNDNLSPKNRVKRGK